MLIEEILTERTSFILVVKATKLIEAFANAIGMAPAYQLKIVQPNSRISMVNYQRSDFQEVVEGAPN